MSPCFLNLIDLKIHVSLFYWMTKERMYYNFLMIFGFILKLETLSFNSCVENNGVKDEFFNLRIEKPLALNFCGLK